MDKPMQGKMKKSVHIEEADNGYTVRSYNGDKEMMTVHNSMEDAMGSMMKMMGKGMKKEMAKMDNKKGKKTSDGVMRNA